jgi:hypothetical protein
MVDFEDRNASGFGKAIGAAVETRSEQHELPSALV